MSVLRVAPGFVVMACSTAVVLISAPSHVPPPSPDLLGVRSVYILAMRSGFDQYLANELTRSGVLRVVTEPHRADAVLTDHLGESFQQQMEDLFPPPPKPKAKVEAKKLATKPDDSKDDETKPELAKPEIAKPDSKDETVTPSEESVDDSRPVTNTINAKGNFFLVGREGRAVLWSDFRDPRSRQPKDMKRAAEAVASDLKRALQPPDSGSK